MIPVSTSPLPPFARPEFPQVLTYTLVGQSGPDHDKLFDVQVTLNGDVVGSGSGRSKKRAEQMAAKAAVEKLFPQKV